MLEKPSAEVLEAAGTTAPAPAARTVEGPTRRSTDRPAPRRIAEPRRSRLRQQAKLRVPATDLDDESLDTDPAPPRTVRTPGPERPRPASVNPATLSTAWVVLVLLAITGIVLTRSDAGVPDFVRQASATVIATALAWALAVRTGGRPLWAAALTGGLAVAAFATDWQPLLAGGSVATGVLAAGLAIMSTTPAATFPLAIREVLGATAVAWVGAFGVLGFGADARPDVDEIRFGYVVLGLALAGAFALVYRLGAGLHGLGRRGYVVAGGAVLFLAFALAYSEALAQWGSRDLVGSVDDFRDSIRSTFGAVPHPIMALLGYPALLWGVFMRARRRQGWWVCAFGVAATAPITTRLVATDIDPGGVLLGLLYSLVIGIALGYAVIRIEHLLTGSHGRRARRDEEAVAHRPEPGRTRPLR